MLIATNELSLAFLLQASAREPHQPKRTMAGALVQDTKLNGIALVPQEISMIVSRFLPLFNPEMFPHKPPPAALAKRLLFSEAEDEYAHAHIL